METLSTLLALCEGNPLVNYGFSLFICNLNLVMCFGCQPDEPCGFSGDHWQMQQCFNVFADIYTVFFFLVLFHCCILLEIKLTTTTKGPVMQSFDVSFDDSLNKQLNKRFWGRWINLSWCSFDATVMELHKLTIWHGVTGVTLVKLPYAQESRQQDPVTLWSI